MIDFLKKIIRAKYQTLNTVEIIKDNILHNVDYLYSLQEQAEIFPVLKSNAYGHGLIDCAKCLEKSGVDYLGVALVEEAETLRN